MTDISLDINLYLLPPVGFAEAEAKTQVLVNIFESHPITVGGIPISPQVRLTWSPNMPFLFLDLPVEIRCMIYEFVFGFDRSIRLVRDRDEKEFITVRNHFSSCVHGIHQCLLGSDSNKPHIHHYLR